MSSLDKTSIFVENQLPGFIRGNPEYALFIQFLQKYYEFLELPGNPIYELRRANENYDVDLARKTLLRYFKDKILPSFPEETELSTERIIKASRDFYAKKGTPDSFRFLFRVLYGQEVDVFLPKTNILRASDGKWQIPQAIRISFADDAVLLKSNVSVNVATPNIINYFGNLATSGITANSFVRIKNEKRKILNVDTTLNTLTVDVRFANTPASANSGFIYQTGNSIYRLLTNDNASFDYSLLTKRLAVGSNSKTSCIIENAFNTYDKDTGQEIAELYVSNVNREFQSGENLEVEYKDTNGVTKVFSSKIISLVSNVLLLKDRFNRTRGGSRYLPGDPVVFYGGLDTNSDQATKAIAVVKTATTGGIDVTRLIKSGYYFRDEANGGLIQIQSTSGVGANLLIDEIWTDGGFSNSALFSFATDSLAYKKDILLNDIDFLFDNVTNNVGFTIGAGNTTTTVNLNTATYIASSSNNYFNSFVLSITDGTGAGQSATISSYNGITKIATLATPLSVTPDGTSQVRITANAQTEIGRAMTYDTFVLGKIKSLDLIKVGSLFADPPTFEAISTFETDYSEDFGFQYIPGTLSGDVGFYGYDPLSVPYPTIKLGSSNNQFSLANGFYTGTRLFVDTGDNAHYADVVDYIVTDPLTSANVKTLFLDRKFENNINPLNINRFNLFFDYRANVRNVGRIGALEIINGGVNYSAADRINFIGTGVGAQAIPIVDGSGKIVDAFFTSLTNRGEGYYGPIQAVINTSSGGISTGTGANLVVWGLSDGEVINATTTEVGKITTFDILNRGFAYLSTPNVSLKVLDVFSSGVGQLGDIISNGDLVWQGGATNANATFFAVVDDVYDIPGTSNSIIRLYDYNGTLSNTALNANTTLNGNVVFSVTPHVGSYSFKGIYSSTERTYPYYYGDGLAKATAEFLNGLIKYQGYYLNTDGFLSADQHLQNKDYYHNFSYEIQSEKSLDEYKSTLYEVVHPAGTQVLSKFLIKGDVDSVTIQTSNLSTSNISSGQFISATHANNVLFGAGSANLANTANVGDIIVINTNNDYAEYVRTITSLVPEIFVDNPIGDYGDGLLRVVTGSNVAYVFANTLPIINIANISTTITLHTAANGNWSVNVISTTNAGTIFFDSIFPYANQNLVYEFNPTLIDVPYRIIKTIG
jgi:hypothetical protein